MRQAHHYEAIRPNAEPPVRGYKRIVVVASLLLAAAAVALVTMTASRAPTSTTVLAPMKIQQVVQQKLSSSGSGDHGAVSAISAPTGEDMEVFSADANAALAGLGVSSIDELKADHMVKSCGVLMLPCVAKIGACVNSHMKTTEGGKLSATASACQCFSDGIMETFNVPSKPHMKLACPFQCAESIYEQYLLHMAKINGEKGEMMECASNFHDVAAALYGSDSNSEIPSPKEDNGFTIEPIDDKTVIEAAEALVANLNGYRSLHCAGKPLWPSPAHVLWAESGLAEGSKEYRLEVNVGGNRTFDARVFHLPHDEQHFQGPGSSESPEDMTVAKFRVETVHPDPCSEGLDSHLVALRSTAAKINHQKLSWTAVYMPGRTKAQHAMGRIPLTPEERKAYTVELDVTGFEPPSSHDPRSDPDMANCMAYRVLNQGGCGSCYAFAAATAYSERLCRNSEGRWNVVVSPQELMDCSKGCDGGTGLNVYENLAGDKPAVSRHCDPYKEKKEVCGQDQCTNEIKYKALSGSPALVGAYNKETATAEEKQNKLLQMQKEVLDHGAAVLSYEVFDDFYNYNGKGVYTKSAGAKSQGHHAVAVIGWGEEGGVPYWLFQNSWGDDSGDKGFYKIRRGTNECDLESEGFEVTRPLIPTRCPTATCKDKGEITGDCGCRCYDGWKGAQCDTCSYTCKAGGQLYGGCRGCHCPINRKGAECEGGYTLSTTTAKSGDGTKLTVSWDLTGSAKPPIFRSSIGIYKLDATGELDELKYHTMCNDAVADKRCAAQGSVQLDTSLAVGRYKVAVATRSLPNEFGQGGGFGDLSSDATIGFFTVLAAGASAEEVAAAADLNDPLKIFAAKHPPSSPPSSPSSVTPAVTPAPTPEPTPPPTTTPAPTPAAPAIYPSLTVGGSAGGITLWSSGAPEEVCYQIDSSQNTDPKHLIMFSGDGSSGSYYAYTLVGYGPNADAPHQASACFEVDISSSTPDGQNTIMLTGPSPSQHLVNATFTFASAFLYFSSYTSWSDGKIDLQVWWMVNQPQSSSPHDVIEIHNGHGDLVHWFYTSCGCQHEPGAEAVSSGSHSFTLPKDPSGFTSQFLPGGGYYVGAVDYPWIDWEYACG